MVELTVRECMVLDVERQRWAYAGAKTEMIRDRLGMTPTRFAQVLGALLDRPEALAHDPMLVNRLRRLRDARRTSRRRLAS